MASDTLIRVRLGSRDARSETGQVEAVRLLELFHDAATELCIREIGDEGILRTYANVEFFAPLRVGDYIEIRGRITEVGAKTCVIELVAHKIIRTARTMAAPLAGEVLDPPRLVGRAKGTWLIPLRPAAEATLADDTQAADEGEVATEAQVTDTASNETHAEPLSWGGHRPKDQPAPKRRPGPEVRMRDENQDQREWSRSRPASSDRPPRRERSYDDRPDRNRPQSDRPYGDRSRSDRPTSDRPYGDRPRDDRPHSDRPRRDERWDEERPRPKRKG